MIKKPGPRFFSIFRVFKFLYAAVWIANRFWIWMLLVITGLVGIMPPLIAWINGKIVSAITMAINDRDALAVLTFWIIVSAVIRLAMDCSSSVYIRIALKRLSIASILQMKRLLQEKTSSMKLEHTESPRVQKLVERVNDFIKTKYEFFQMEVVYVGRFLITVVLSACIIASYNIFFIPVIVLGIVPVFYLRLKENERMYIINRNNQDKRRLAGYFFDLLTGHRSLMELRLFKLENHFIRKQQELEREMAEERYRFQKKTGLLQGSVEGVLSAVCYLVCLALAIFLIRQGSLGIGAFVVLVQLILILQKDFINLGFNIRYMHEAALYGNDFVELLTFDGENLPRSVLLPAMVNNRAQPGIKRPALSPPAVSLENVSFTYALSDKPCLLDISLDIKPGEIIALVGRNGSGKTTLAKLLLGLYAPTGGAVYINGKNINDWEKDTLYQYMSGIFQDFVHYELPVRDNIVFGNYAGNADSAKMRYAAEKADALGFINELKDSFDTSLGTVSEGGQNLSGGQWQKLAIARILFADTPFVILDEPNASLDPLTEVSLYRQYKEILAGHSVLMISHRLGSARTADRILVLGEGRIIEEGTHEQLMSLNCEYAAMFKIQADWYK